MKLGKIFKVKVQLLLPALKIGYIMGDIGAKRSEGSGVIFLLGYEKDM